MRKLIANAVVISAVLLVSGILVEEVDARGRGGGGGGFSRAGIASGGGLSGRTRQPMRAQVPSRSAATGHVEARQGKAVERSAAGQDRQGARYDQRQEMAGERQASVQSHSDDRGDRQEDRQDFEEERQEDRQEFAEERQEDRQDFVEDEIDDDWDNCCDWDDDDGEFIAGAIVGGVVVGAAAAARQPTTNYVTTLPCTPTEVNVSGVTYLKCASTWYQKSFAGTQVTYVVVPPPAGF